MFKDPRFWFALAIILAAMSFASRHAGAQEPASTAMVSFDALTRSSRPPAAAKPVSRPSPTVARRVDTVRVGTTDTVRVTKTDTVHVTRIDTVVIARQGAATTPAAPAKSAAPAAPAFAPSSVAGLLQVQLTGGDSALRATYRIRRAEVKVTTDLGRRAQAVVMIDVAKSLSLSTSGATPSVSQSSRVLQDAYLVLPVRVTTIDAGQQRLPLGYEGGMGSSGLETIDRALFESDRARGGALGDVRDLGVAARGSVKRFDYKVGVFNGTGESMNETDRNVGKSVVGQVAVRPAFIKGLRVGASGATSGAAAGDNPVRDRLGADLVYASGPASLQAEVMTGKDGAVSRQGMYVLGGFKPHVAVKLVARFDAFDPNVDREGTPADVTERDYLAGVTWMPPATRLKLHLAVVHRTYSSRITPTNTQLLSQVQAAW